MSQTILHQSRATPATSALMNYSVDIQRPEMHHAPWQKYFYLNIPHSIWSFMSNNVYQSTPYSTPNMNYLIFTLSSKLSCMTSSQPLLPTKTMCDLDITRSIKWTNDWQDPRDLGHSTPKKKLSIRHFEPKTYKARKKNSPKNN